MAAVGHCARLPMLVASVSRNNVGAVGAIALQAPLARLRHLRDCNLSSNRLGSAGMATLATGLQCLRSLRRLSLCNNALGRDGVAALSLSLPALPQLRCLTYVTKLIGDSTTVIERQSGNGDVQCASRAACLRESPPFGGLRPLAVPHSQVLTPSSRVSQLLWTLLMTKQSISERLAGQWSDRIGVSTWRCDSVDGVEVRPPCSNLCRRTVGQLWDTHPATSMTSGVLDGDWVCMGCAV